MNTTDIPTLIERRAWIFDLDNTLYPPSVRLFDQIERRMTDYVMRVLGLAQQEADALRHRYWADHGTTLSGLMHHHDIDPDPFLEEVHDISFHDLAPDHSLRGSLSALPGRRIVFTNGAADYAEKVLEARGLSGVFHAVYGIEHAGYRPKPEKHAFDTILASDGMKPETAVMFEDDARNLRVPHALGMATVHVTGDDRQDAHVHYKCADLTAFLAGLLDQSGTSHGPSRLSSDAI